MDLKTKNEVIGVLTRIENRIMKYQQENGFETIFDFINEDVSIVKDRVAANTSQDGKN